jgi:FkbM family methyltransferase
VLDIGSQWGIFTYEFCSKVGEAGEVYAFDPHPVHSDAMQATKERNDLSNLSIEQVAVSNEAGTAALNIHHHNSGMASLSPRDTAVYDEKVEVHKVTLSNWLEKKEIEHISLIKIDVEGSELNVVKGLGDQLGAVSDVVLEVHQDVLPPSDVQDFVQRLREYGSISGLHSDSPDLRGQSNVVEHWHWQNGTEFETG